MGGTTRWNRAATRRIVRIAATVVAGVAGMGAVVACEPAACTTNWVGTSPGSWTDGGSWDLGHAPAAGDVACLPADATVTVPAGLTEITGLKTAGSLHLTPGATLAIAHTQIQGATTARIEIDGGATLRLAGGAGLLTMDGGALVGEGTVEAGVVGATSIAPGDPAVAGDRGVLSVIGTADLTNTTVLIDVAGDGKVPGTGHDQLNIGGAVTFATTTIAVAPAAGFAPAPAQTMHAVTYPSATGTPVITGVPDLRGTGRWMSARSEVGGVDLPVTQCDPAVYKSGASFVTNRSNLDLRWCALDSTKWWGSFTNIDFSGADLHGSAQLFYATFDGSNFTGADLSSVAFGGSGPTSSSFANADLTGATLTNAVLSGANLSGTSFVGADLAGANLSGANLAGARSGSVTGTPSWLPAGWSLRSGYLIGPGADLTGADLAGASLSGVRSGGITGTPLSLPPGWSLLNGYLIGPGANLSGANLSGLALTGHDLTGANLSGATLTNANLNGVLLVGANLTNANVKGATVQSTNFSSATLTGLRSGGNAGSPYGLTVGWAIRNSYLIGPGADLSGENLSGLDFTYGVFTNANLSNATLSASVSYAAFDGANLTNADLTSAAAYQSTFVGADLTGANLTNAVLTGADLTNANLTNTTVTGARLATSLVTGLRGSGVVGTPMTLPTFWEIRSGFLVGRGANLSGFTFDNMWLGGLHLSGANLSGATVRNLQVFATDFTNANLSGATFENVGVNMAIMTGANMGSIPVGGQFGTGLLFYAAYPAYMTPPTGWMAPTSVPNAPFSLLRVS